MRSTVLHCPSRAEEFPRWALRIADGYSNGIPLVVDLRAASWVRIPAEVVNVLRRLGVTVDGVCVEDESLPMPRDLRKVSSGSLQQDWCVCPNMDVLEIDRRTRGGQVIRYDGDVRIRGNLASGAEIFAGGSIRVDGEMRGRVYAGCSAENARVICLGMKAEMVAIGDHKVIGEQVSQIWGLPTSVAVSDGKVVFADID